MYHCYNNQAEGATPVPPLQIKVHNSCCLSSSLLSAYIQPCRKSRWPKRKIFHVNTHQVEQHHKDITCHGCTWIIKPGIPNPFNGIYRQAFPFPYILRYHNTGKRIVRDTYYIIIFIIEMLPCLVVQRTDTAKGNY